MLSLILPSVLVKAKKGEDDEGGAEGDEEARLRLLFRITHPRCASVCHLYHASRLHAPLLHQEGGTGIVDFLDSDEEEIDPDSLAPTKARSVAIFLVQRAQR